MLRKGIQYLLEAWQQLGWRDAELLLVGKVMPDSQPVLKHYTDLPGLHLMGYIPDQLTALQNAHAFVMPSVERWFWSGRDRGDGLWPAGGCLEACRSGRSSA